MKKNQTQKSIKIKVVMLLVVLIVASATISAIHFLNIGNIHGIIEVSDPPITISGMGVPVEITHQLSLGILENQTITEEIYNGGNACYQVEFIVDNISNNLSLYITPSVVNVMPGETVYVDFNYTAGLVYGTMYSNISIIISACSFITVVDEPIVCSAFDITPYNGTCDPGSGNVCTQVINDAKDGTVVCLKVDTMDNCLDGNYTSMNFTIIPVPPIGASCSDLATIYFSSPYDMKYNGEYVLLVKDGYYYANWSINDDETTTHYIGSHVMFMCNVNWIEIHYRLDGDSMGNAFNTVGDSTSFDIEFWNADRSWSWTYTVTLLCIQATP